jgi:hypothetical protein
MFVIFCCCGLGMMMFSAGNMVVFWLMHMKALFDDKLFILLSMFNILTVFCFYLVCAE